MFRRPLSDLLQVSGAMYSPGFSKKLGCRILESGVAPLKLLAGIVMLNCFLGWSEKSLYFRRTHHQTWAPGARSQCGWLGRGNDHLFCQAQDSRLLWEYVLNQVKQGQIWRVCDFHWGLGMSEINVNFSFSLKSNNPRGIFQPKKPKAEQTPFSSVLIVNS